MKYKAMRSLVGALGGITALLIVSAFIVSDMAGAETQPVASSSASPGATRKAEGGCQTLLNSKMTAESEGILVVLEEIQEADDENLSRSAVRAESAILDVLMKAGTQEMANSRVVSVSIYCTAAYASA